MKDVARAKIAYLVSQFPATSHTFIRREVAALRMEGMSVNTYSVRKGDVEDADKVTPTFNILEQSALSFAVCHTKALIRHPVRYCSTLRLALSHRVPGVRSLVWAIFHFVEAIVLAVRLRRDGITRLHNHFANSAATVGLLAVNFERMPWSLTLHGISEFDYPAGVLLPQKLQRADFAACVSWFGMAQAMRLIPPAAWPRLALVRCGIDLNDLPERRPHSGGGDPFNLICVGRLSPEKGHAGLIGVVAALIGEGRSLRLTLVGDGPEEVALRRLARQLNVEDAVLFRGRLDERDTLVQIAQADGLALTSFMEGLPMVLIEALALEIPVVASRVAGIPELIKDGETGILFDPGHWEDLHCAMKRMLDESDSLPRLAARGRQRVVQEFTYPMAAIPLLSLLSHKGD